MVSKKLSSNLKNNKLTQMFNTYAYTNLVLEMYKIKYFLGHPVIIAASSCRRDSMVGACVHTTSLYGQASAIPLICSSDSTT